MSWWGSILNCILQKINICDVIKQNELELAIIDFEIQPIIALNSLCISLFWASLTLLYLWNLMINFDGGFSKICWGWGIHKTWKLYFYLFSSSDSFWLMIASHIGNILDPIHAFSRSDWHHKSDLPPYASGCCPLKVNVKIIERYEKLFSGCYVHMLAILISKIQEKSNFI